jgi:hypothetical protein
MLSCCGLLNPQITKQPRILKGEKSAGFPHKKRDYRFKFQLDNLGTIYVSLAAMAEAVKSSV